MMDTVESSFEEDDAGTDDAEGVSRLPPPNTLHPANTRSSGGGLDTGEMTERKGDEVERRGRTRNVTDRESSNLAVSSSSSLSLSSSERLKAKESSRPRSLSPSELKAGSGKKGGKQRKPEKKHK